MTLVFPLITIGQRPGTAGFTGTLSRPDSLKTKQQGSLAACPFQAYEGAAAGADLALRNPLNKPDNATYRLDNLLNFHLRQTNGIFRS